MVVFISYIVTLLYLISTTISQHILNDVYIQYNDEIQLNNFTQSKSNNLTNHNNSNYKKHIENIHTTSINNIDTIFNPSQNNISKSIFNNKNNNTNYSDDPTYGHYFTALPIDINSPYIDLIVRVNCGIDPTYCTGGSTWKLTLPPPIGCPSAPDITIQYTQNSQWFNDKLELILQLDDPYRFDGRQFIHPWSIACDINISGSIDDGGLSKSVRCGQRGEFLVKGNNNNNDGNFASVDVPQIVYGIIRLTESTRCPQWQTTYSSYTVSSMFTIDKNDINLVSLTKHPTRHDFGSLRENHGYASAGLILDMLPQNKTPYGKNNNHNNNNNHTNHNHKTEMERNNETNNHPSNFNHGVLNWGFTLGGIPVSSWNLYAPVVQLIPHGLMQFYIEPFNLIQVMNNIECVFSDFEDDIDDDIDDDDDDDDEKRTKTSNGLKKLNVKWIQDPVDLLWRLMFDLPVHQPNRFNSSFPPQSSSLFITEPTIYPTRTAHTIRCTLQLTGDPAENLLPHNNLQTNSTGFSLLFSQENEFSPTSVITYTVQSQYSPLKISYLGHETVLTPKLVHNQQLRFLNSLKTQLSNKIMPWGTYTLLEYEIEQYDNDIPDDNDAIQALNNTILDINNLNSNNDDNDITQPQLTSNNNDNPIPFDPLLLTQRRFSLLISDIAYSGDNISHKPPSFSLICNNTIFAYGDFILSDTYYGMYFENLYQIGRFRLRGDWNDLITEHCQAKKFIISIQQRIIASALPFIEDSDAYNEVDDLSTGQHQNTLVAPRFSYLDTSFVFGPVHIHNDTDIWSTPLQSIFSTQFHYKKNQLAPNRSMRLSGWIQKNSSQQHGFQPWQCRCDISAQINGKNTPLLTQQYRPEPRIADSYDLSHLEIDLRTFFTLNLTKSDKDNLSFDNYINPNDIKYVNGYNISIHSSAGAWEFAFDVDSAVNIVHFNQDNTKMDPVQNVPSDINLTSINKIKPRDFTASSIPNIFTFQNILYRKCIARGFNDNRTPKFKSKDIDDIDAWSAPVYIIQHLTPPYNSFPLSIQLTTQLPNDLSKLITDQSFSTNNSTDYSQSSQSPLHTTVFNLYCDGLHLRRPIGFDLLQENIPTTNDGFNLYGNRHDYDGNNAGDVDDVDDDGDDDDEEHFWGRKSSFIVLALTASSDEYSNNPAATHQSLTNKDFAPVVQVYHLQRTSGFFTLRNLSIIITSLCALIVLTSIFMCIYILNPKSDRVDSDSVSQASLSEKSSILANNVAISDGLMNCHLQDNNNDDVTSVYSSNLNHVPSYGATSVGDGI